MYDLNLSIPNITSEKYTVDRRLAMLKNYLNELNESVAFALGDKVDLAVNELRQKSEEEYKSYLRQIDNCRSQNTALYEELQNELTLVKASETLKCEKATNTDEVQSYVMYYTFSNMVFVQVSFKTASVFEAGVTYYPLRIPKHIPSVFVPLQSYADLSENSKTNAGIMSETGRILFRSDTELPEGTLVCISGWYSPENRQEEG